MELTTITEANWVRITSDHWTLEILGYVGQVVTQTSGAHVWTVSYRDPITDHSEEVEWGIVDDERQQSDVMRTAEDVIRNHHGGA